MTLKKGQKVSFTFYGNPETLYEAKCKVAKELKKAL